MFQRMVEIAEMVLSDCFNLRRHERVVVLCDPPCYETGRAFYEAATDRCKDSVMVMIPSVKLSGGEPPEPVHEWLKQFDVAIIPTAHDISHTLARQAATEQGVRIATLPGITPEVLLRTMQNWRKSGTFTRKVAARLSGTKSVKITTALGTNLFFQVGGRIVYADDGRLTSRGAFGTIPPGEVTVSPQEGTAEGTLVFDRCFSLREGRLEEPLILQIKGGSVVKVEKHPCAADLEKLFLRYRQPGRTCAEFGIGTLESAQCSGNLLEERKVQGTVHISLGSNITLGGSVSVPLHLDGVLSRGTVYLDDKLWVNDGAFV